MIPFTSPYGPVGICIATGELTRYAAFNQSLAMLHVTDRSCMIWTMGPLIAANMNRNFKSFLDHPDNLQWAWIIGDDHTFDSDVIIKLLSREKDVIVPICLNREPPCSFVIIDEMNNHHRDFTKVPTSGIFKLEEFEVCGDAGMLLSRRVVEAMGPPWYESLVSGTYVSEDRYFARKLRAKGFDIWIDTETALGHITPCQIKPLVHPETGEWNVQFSVGHTPLVQFRPVIQPD